MIVFEGEGSIGGVNYCVLDTGGTPDAYFGYVCFEEGWIYTSIEEQLTNALELYPNPAHSNWHKGRITKRVIID